MRALRVGIAFYALALAVCVSVIVDNLYPNRARAGFAVGPGAGGGGGPSVTGTGLAHVTGGTFDGAAVHGTSGQMMVSTGSDMVPATISGDVTCVSGGACTVGKISGSSPVAITPANLQFTQASFLVALNQVATNSGTNATSMTIQAQGTTVGNGDNGGALNLLGGVGDTANLGLTGPVNIETADGLSYIKLGGIGPNGGIGSVELSGAYFDFEDGSGNLGATLGLSPSGINNFTFVKTITGLTYVITQNNTASGNGAAITFQAQSETGTTSNGGGLNFKSGTGTTTNGTVGFYSGSTNVFDLTETGPEMVPVSVAITTGTTTLSRAQYHSGWVTLTGTLSGNVTVVWPSTMAAGTCVYVDSTAVVLSAHTITYQINSNNWGTTVAAAVNIAQLCYNGTKFYGPVPFTP